MSGEQMQAEEGAFDRPRCDHAWTHRHFPGALIYWVGRCVICGDVDVEDLNQQVRELIAHRLLEAEWLLDELRDKGTTT